jgi:hypothetical protein
VKASTFVALVIGLARATVAAAQEPPPHATSPPAEATGISAEQMAKANNPLADMNGLNFHDYWSSAIRGLPDDYSNTLNLRGVMVAGRQIIRATVPVTTAPLGGGPYASGLGDISIFDAIKLTEPVRRPISPSARCSSSPRRRTMRSARASGRRVGLRSSSIPCRVAA